MKPISFRIRQSKLKKTFIISVLILTSLIILFFISTSFVDNTPYFESDYYKKSFIRIDSLKSVAFKVNDSIQAGLAKVSITPKLKNYEDNYSKGKFSEVPLAGYGARKGKPATGIHDSIFVTAVALKVGRQTVILVTADLLIMPPNIIDSVTSLLHKEGIRREQLFFSATHTHSSLGGWGPGYIGRQFAGNENKNIQKWLVLRISEAITVAISDLRPSRIGSGFFDAGEYTQNRLIGESGKKNDEFSFITIEQIGHNKAIIGSFSAHTTTLGAENMKISADYPGYWARKMESWQYDYALFFAGSMGSQSPAGPGRGFDRAKFIGEALADSLYLRLPEVIMHDKVEFSYVSLKMELPDYRIRITNKLTLSTNVSNKLMPVSQNNYLQAIRIGDIVWITTPADFSGEYALQIKNSLAVKGYNANITSFNGGYVGYIIPGRYFYLDEYESKTMGWFGPHMGDYTMNLIRYISEIVTGTK